MRQLAAKTELAAKMAHLLVLVLTRMLMLMPHQ